MGFKAFALSSALAGATLLLGGCLATTVVGGAAKVAGTAVGVTAKRVGMAAHGVGSVVAGGKKDEASDR